MFLFVYHSSFISRFSHNMMEIFNSLHSNISQTCYNIQYGLITLYILKLQNEYLKRTVLYSNFEIALFEIQRPHIHRYIINILYERFTVYLTRHQHNISNKIFLTFSIIHMYIHTAGLYVCILCYSINSFFYIT